MKRGVGGLEEESTKVTKESGGDKERRQGGEGVVVERRIVIE